MTFRQASFSAVFCLACSALSAQVVTSSAVSGGGGRAIGSFSFAGMPMPMQSITGAPFSGVRESEHTQTLADGTHISQKFMMQKIYRDADGRMRTERAAVVGPNMGPNTAGPDGNSGMPMIVQISDPVGGYSYTLDTQNKIAHRMAVSQAQSIPPPPPPQLPSTVQRQGQMGGTVSPGQTGTAGAWFESGPAVAIAGAGGIVSAFPPGTTQAQRPQFQHESLGTKIIDGLLVQGTKMTMTIPAGAQGNDRPISTVTETWTSPDLKEMIESVSSDPRNGESITRLTQIDRNNPDPSLFQIPADYQVTDEQGPFNIRFNRVQPQRP